MRGWLRGLTALAILVAIWAAASEIAHTPLAPGPIAVGRALLGGVRDGTLVAGAARRASCASSSATSLALAIGVPLGIGARALAPREADARADRPRARARCRRSAGCPLAILWFGLSEWAIQLVVVLGAALPIAVATENAVRHVPPSIERAARTMGARGARLMLTVTLPAALPGILGGAKVGWTFALRSLMAGELLFVSGGLGQLLETGRDLGDTALVLAVVVVIVALGRASEVAAVRARRPGHRASLGRGGRMSDADDGVRALRRGKVWLVGRGPGRSRAAHGARAPAHLAGARVVAYDELVSPAILALAPADAERIPVGRRAGGCRHHEARIHPLVVVRALEGTTSSASRAAIPFVFGRGGEEAEELDAARVPFEVVPGISAALGAAASTGIPLTHRECASSVTFATAHAAAARRLDSRRNVPAEGTVVFYMGLGRIEATCAALVAGGRPRETPAAVVSNATLPDERVVRGTLGDIGVLVREARLEAPALLVVGEVVARAVESVPSAAAGAAVRLRS